MTTDEHLTDDRLHDWAEGLLEGADRSDVDSHLDGCPACRDRAEELRGLLTELGELPVEASAPEGLWAGIEARIGAAAGGEAGVVPLPGASRNASEGPRRLSFTVGQLLAAGIVLAALSGGAVWMAMGPAGTTSGVTGVPGGPRGILQTAATQEAIADYDAAAADLEALVQEGREVLRPETVEVLEESLQTIDGAIAEARGALATDPGSEVLYRLLARNMKRKLEILRSAAQAINAAS